MARTRKPAPDPINGNGNLLPPVAVVDVEERPDINLGKLLSGLRAEIYELKQAYAAGRAAQEPRTPLVFSAIRNVMKDIIPLAKTHEHEDQGFYFRTIDELATRLQPLFVEHGLFIAPELLEEKEAERAVLTDHGSYAQFFTKTKVQYRVYCALDGSSLPFPCATMGEGMSEQHFSTNASQTMAFKQLLTQLFMIPVFGAQDPESIVGERSQVSAQPSVSPDPTPAQPGNLFGEASTSEWPKARRVRRAKEPQVVEAGNQQAPWESPSDALDAAPPVNEAPIGVGFIKILRSSMEQKSVSEVQLFEHMQVLGWDQIKTSQMPAALAFIRGKEA